MASLAVDMLAWFGFLMCHVPVSHPGVGPGWDPVAE